jgi:hypothetical protein
MSTQTRSQFIRYTISDFNLGKNDGKKEATYISNFKDSFYDYKKIKDRAKSPETYLILGQKGSGKTLLSQVIKADSEFNPNHFCEIGSLKSFDFQTLISEEGIENSQKESLKYYNAIWEWVILVQLGQIILRDESLYAHEEHIELKSFFDANYSGNFEINTKRIVEETLNKGVNLGFEKIFSAGAELGKEKTLRPGIFLNYVRSLKEYIMKLLAKSTNQYTLFYDELDDNFENTGTYKNIILSLVNCANDLNVDFYQQSCFSKIVILLRSDIFFMLNHPDLEKIRQSNSMELKWGDTCDYRSPLFTMILKKIRKSVSQFSEYEYDDDLFKKLFMNIEMGKHILEKTLLRPRDVITYLNLVIEQAPRSILFKESDCKKIEKDYSNYLSREIRNTLSGVLENDDIDGTYFLLRKFGNPRFQYKELATVAKQNKNSLPENYDLAKCLRAFFKANAIGYSYYRKKRTIVVWNYRTDADAQLDLNENMKVHKGLEKFLLLEV